VEIIPKRRIPTMDEFNFTNNRNTANARFGNGGNGGPGGGLKDECVIAFKVYDSCRQQDCLDSNLIGPARAASTGTGCNPGYTVGEIITPPASAAAVTISNLRVSDVIVVSKVPNTFRPGYWDIDLKYVFSYTISFRNINGEVSCTVDAQSVFNKTATLFGSVATDTTLATDLTNSSTGGESASLSGAPFVLVESKAVALKAVLGYDNCCCDNNEATEVNVTIGLFTIIKLYRLVNLIVESKGFCIPEQCTNTAALNPCEYFENLDFPLDIFDPPQKREFFAGISSNIPAETQENGANDGCGCRNNNNNGCGCGCRNS
jgi:hypothetical protein